jgi:TatA/E family protein of Tat protein translocase
MFNIGPLELMVILIVALVVVGPKRLPEVGKTIGKSLREFRKATDEVKQSFDFSFDDDFEPDPPASSRHVETLPDADEFPARHVETLPESDELPGERFDGFEEPGGFDEPSAPQVLDGHQATTEEHPPNAEPKLERDAEPKPEPKLDPPEDTATVEIQDPESVDEPEYRRSSGSTNGEQPARPPSAPPAAEPD